MPEPLARSGLNAAGPLVVRGLAKSFPFGGREIPVLRGVSFTAKPGESLALLGPSGSGKSTLLHLLGTLEPPSAGEIHLGGLDLLAIPGPELARFRNERVGFVFQDHHLLPQYSALENVLLPALAFQRHWRDLRPRAAALLERVGLGERMRHRPAELSGGERQRAAVARALLLHPALLLCDEPTGSLDHATADEIADLLLELQSGGETILIAATHSRELAGRFGRRLELRDGLCSEA